MKCLGEFLLVIFATLVLAMPGAHAGKIDEAQKAIQLACKKNISNAEALRFVKDLFMNCNPGAEVDIDGCNVKCLKTNTNILGS